MFTQLDVDLLSAWFQLCFIRFDSDWIGFGIECHFDIQMI